MKIKTYQTLVKDPVLYKRKIADFWDKTTEGWYKIWGPHIHHGYYEKADTKLDRIIAQEKLIEKLLEVVPVHPGDQVLDVGCGIGGTSFYLRSKYQAVVTGISLSAWQVKIAELQAFQKKIDQVVFKVEDALLLNSFPENTFDIVWSLESCEQFQNKELFFKQALRVLKPGGKLLLATWCSSEDEFENKLARQYRKLCVAFDLPYMPSIKHYLVSLASQGFHIVNQLDWTEQVAKSWDVGLSLLQGHSLWEIFKLSGWRGVKIAFKIKLMRNAFRDGLLKYGVFVASK